MDAFRKFGSLGIVMLMAGTSSAQGQPVMTSVGPGRITCANAKSCHLTIGTPARMRTKIDPSGLAAPDKERLTKQCTANATPCIATVTGVDNNDDIKAASIKFHN